MIDVYVFFNTKVEYAKDLPLIDDIILAPVRYLFDGKTIRIQDKGQEIEIHRVASFHKNGFGNFSKTDASLRSSSKRMIKTALAVILLIPSLIIGVMFKGLTYLLPEIRKKHLLAREHLTPVNKEIGSIAQPIKTQDELKQALEAARKSDPINHSINTLIIHGDGNLKINEDPGILQFNPRKLVLEGIEIVHKPTAGVRLTDAMKREDKWLIDDPRETTSSNPDASGVNTHSINSSEDALKFTTPRRNWYSYKRYHMIFHLARP